MAPYEAHGLVLVAVRKCRFSIDCLNRHKINPRECNGLKQRYSEQGRLDMLPTGGGLSDQDTVWGTYSWSGSLYLCFNMSGKISACSDMLCCVLALCTQRHTALEVLEAGGTTYLKCSHRQAATALTTLAGCTA